MNRPTSKVYIFTVTAGDPDYAIGPKRDRVEQVATIHPTITEQFIDEVYQECKRQSDIRGVCTAAYFEYEGVYDHIIGCDPMRVT